MGNTANLLESILSKGIDTNPLLVLKPGCFGTIAFSEDERCRSCECFEHCANVDRTKAYLNVADELVRLAAEYKLNDELQQLHEMGLVDSPEPESDAIVPVSAGGAFVANDGVALGGSPRLAPEAIVARLNWSRLKFRSSVVDFDIEELILQIIAERPTDYARVTEIAFAKTSKPEIAASIYGLLVKILNEMMNQHILSWNQKNKAAGIQWNV